MSNSEKSQRDLLAEAERLLGKQYDANGPFNRFFDGDEPLSLPSPRREVGAYEYERSRALYWLDRAAYEDERTAWENDTQQTRHREVLELLRAESSETSFRDLIAAVSRSRVVPFVGAGMSKPMEMPLWGEALRKLLARFPSADSTKIGAQIDAGDYLNAAQALAAHDQVQTENFVRTTYRVHELKLRGPLVLLPPIAKGCVITTNFDDAIEVIYRRENVVFDAHMHGTRETNFFSRLVRGDRCLLKLHGDADDTGSLILTRAQYEQGYGDPKSFDFKKSLPKALRQAFVSQQLLFLGCSMEQDWTLELFLQAQQANEYVIPHHYAILPAPQDARAKHAKATRLLRLNIQPLWYPANEHDYVERYLQLLVDVVEKRFRF
jgi:hypothetical protein